MRKEKLHMKKTNMTVEYQFTLKNMLGGKKTE